MKKPNLSKILVAEDNLMNQLIITRLFETLGYNIDLAEDGKQAIVMAKQTAYDIIFMDIHMPQMNGLEATKHILNHYCDNNAPHIIAMTATVLEEDRDLCLAAGMKDFISKPIFLECLKEILKKWTKAEAATQLV